MAYTISVGIGSPPTSYELLVDTYVRIARLSSSICWFIYWFSGSSNTWVGANKPYVSTSTSSDTGNSVVSSTHLVHIVTNYNLVYRVYPTALVLL